MGIFYKITCDRCAKEYPKELDSEMHYGSFFGTHPDDAALEIKKNKWMITLENNVLCPFCSVKTHSDSDMDKDIQPERLTAAAYKLQNGNIVSGKTHAEAWSKVPAEYCTLPYKKMSEEEAVKELIRDCEIHHHVDKDIISSTERFYEFLHTEVKFHSECWGLNFEKAKKVYEFWAKKYHSVKSNSKKGEGTILIVDDDHSIRRVLKEFLNSKGFVAHAASMAENALEILNEIEVDLVITNINMPGMNGLELIRLIKDRYSSHVIIFTGYRKTCTQEDALRVGADALFYKPAKLKDLLNSVNKIFNR